MEQYNLRAELDARLPISPDDNGAIVDPLMDLLEDFGGVVGRTPAGRIELIFTVQADTIRQATILGLSLIATSGYAVFALEVMPQDEFARRTDAVTMPDLVSVPQAAEILGVSRQRVLELAKGGKLDATKVGDTWVIPRRAVTSLDARTGLRWSGLLVPIGVHSDTDQYIAPDALKIARMVLPLYDEQLRIIGAITQVSLDSLGYHGSGVVRGLAPGDYPVAAYVGQLEAHDDGAVRRIIGGQLEGVTVLTSEGRAASFPTARITVTDSRASLTPAHQGDIEVATLLAWGGPE